MKTKSILIGRVADIETHVRRKPFLIDQGSAEFYFKELCVRYRRVVSHVRVLVALGFCVGALVGFSIAFAIVLSS